MHTLSPRHALLALLLTLTACGSSLGSFQITEESNEATVMGGAGSVLDALPVKNLFPPMQLTINLEDELDQQDAGPAKAVYLEALQMTITDTAQPQGDTDNFDFVNKINVFVESSKSGSALERKQVATLSDVPKGQTLVSFDTDDSIDLKPYIEQGIKLTTEGTGEVPDDDTSLKAIVTLEVKLL